VQQPGRITWVVVGSQRVRFAVESKSNPSDNQIRDSRLATCYVIVFEVAADWRDSVLCGHPIPTLVDS